MGQSDENHDVYNNLTESKKTQQTAKWTVYLALCCLTACMGSFNFGFNIGALNLPTPLIKDFFARKYYTENYFKPYDELQVVKKNYFAEKHAVNVAELVLESQANHTSEEVSSARTIVATLDKPYNGTNGSLNDYLKSSKTYIDGLELELKEKDVAIQKHNTFLWTITNSMFVVGGMFGAFGSKFVLESFGRKKGILFHYIFSISAAIAAFAAFYLETTIAVYLIMASRFLYGIQGGMMCGIVPTYLNEVAPAALRGSCGVINQLCITIGILFAQTLGFRQIFGTSDMWHYILAFPIIPSVVGGLVLLLFFSETPKALLITNKDEEATRTVLQRLRNNVNVEDEIEELVRESKESGNSNESVSFGELFSITEYRWPLITSLLIQLTQQLCGINAIFFYSDGIFRRASIADEHIQYAIFATGFINVICTIVVVPLIEKLGRKPLLVYPMCLMIVDFICLTICLVLQSSNIIYSYLSIFCIIVFICCFAVGLGPIPFIYATEVFRQEARGAALAVCMTTNWIANLILSLSFEYLAVYLQNYVFLVFTCIVAFSVIVIFKKVPETKNKNIDEVLASFKGRKSYDDNTNKPMLETSKV